MAGIKEIASLEANALSLQAEHRYEEAIQSHGMAVDIAQELNRPRLVAVLCNRLGEALESAGQVQRAVITYEAGLKALQGEVHGDLDGVIASLQGAVKGFDQGFKFLEVLDLFTESTSEDLVDAEEDKLLAVRLLINIGNSYLRQPQMNPALNAYNEALQRPEIKSAPDLRAHALTHVAIIYRREGEIDQAVNSLNEALALLEQHPDPVEKRRTLATFGSIYREQGELIQAQSTYRQALELYQQAEDPLGEARALAGLGHILLEQWEFSQARSTFQRSLVLAEQVQDEDTLWHAYWGVGYCQHHEGELEAAVVSFRRCLDKIKNRRRELRTDEGKVTFLESVQDIYDHLIAVQLDRALSAPTAFKDALEIAEEARGQALFDLMGVRRRRFQSRQFGVRDNRARPFPDRLDLMIQAAPAIDFQPGGISPMAQMAPAVQSASSTDLTSLLEDQVWYEDTIGLSDMVETAQAIPSTIPRWSDESITPESEELIQPVPLARLVFHVLADRTAVIAVTPSGEVKGHVSSLGQAEITRLVTELRQAMRVEVDPRDFDLDEDQSSPAFGGDFETLLQTLYSNLISPVEDSLPTDGTPVVIEPHQALWLLPFAALRLSDQSCMIDHWSLLYSPSQVVLEEIRTEKDYGGPKELKPLIVGNPVMPVVANRNGVPVPIQPLPGAERECVLIYNQFEQGKASLLLGESADWASVIAQIPQHGILHLATHGLAYSDKPLDSLVVLGIPSPASLEALEQHPAFKAWPLNNFLMDFISSGAQNGLLTARQIIYLPIPADLVTLSACQTGLGQISGDGMIGLSRSFLVAGARSVLVSQWSVSDEATAVFMAAFYQTYIEVDDKALALQQAMRTLRANPEFSHPRYWAPFVVVGAEA